MCQCAAVTARWRHLSATWLLTALTGVDVCRISCSLDRLLVRKVAETLETGLTVVPLQSSRGTVSKGLTDGAPVYVTHEVLGTF